VHSAEFKEKVGLEAVRGVKTVNEIAQQHGVHPVMVAQWKKEITSRAGTLFEGKRGPKVEAEHEGEDRLYGEIGRLKIELDWLKKSQACKRRRAAWLDRSGRRAVAGAPVRTSRYIEGDRISTTCGGAP
jgi:transposase